MYSLLILVLSNQFVNSLSLCYLYTNIMWCTYFNECKHELMCSFYIQWCTLCPINYYHHLFKCIHFIYMHKLRILRTTRLHTLFLCTCNTHYCTCVCSTSCSQLVSTSLLMWNESINQSNVDYLSIGK
jgi:hypothetical protein